MNRREEDVVPHDKPPDCYSDEEVTVSDFETEKSAKETKDDTLTKGDKMDTNEIEPVVRRGKISSPQLSTGASTLRMEPEIELLKEVQNIGEEISSKVPRTASPIMNVTSGSNMRETKKVRQMYDRKERVVFANPVDSRTDGTETPSLGESVVTTDTNDNNNINKRVQGQKNLRHKSEDTEYDSDMYFSSGAISESASAQESANTRETDDGDREALRVLARPVKDVKHNSNARLGNMNAMCGAEGVLPAEIMRASHLWAAETNEERPERERERCRMLAEMSTRRGQHLMGYRPQ